MNEDYREIESLPDFIDSTRKIAYELLNKTLAKKKEKSDVELLLANFIKITDSKIEEVILDKEIEELILNNLVEKKYKTKLIFIRKKYADFARRVNERLIYNMLRTLASKDFVEVGFDSDTNNFIFWIKYDE